MPFLCQDTETRGRKEARLDDSAKEQSRGEGPGDKLRAKGRRHREKDSKGQGERMEKGGKKKKRGNGQRTLFSVFWILI